MPALATAAGRRSFIGDMQIVRTTRDLQAGTELEFAYRQAEPMESYDETQKQLASWSFTCDCVLCESKKEASKDSLKIREKLMTKLTGILKCQAPLNTTKALALLKKIDKTYASGTTIKMEIWDPYFALGASLLQSGNLVDAVSTFVRGLEALGFVITACPPGQDAEEAKFIVSGWGLVNEFVPWAFVNIHRAYKGLESGLCSGARVYAETTYAMVVGEKETFADTFPDIE